MISIISKPTLEQWDWETPANTGIGGSEISHIECTSRLAARGLPVTSYAPLPANGDYFVGPNDVTWRNSTAIKVQDLAPGVVINYRNPQFYEGAKSDAHKYWYLAQDVDYQGFITLEFIDKVDRYICLCQTHADYTVSKYPELKNKIVISSNGVRTDYIKHFEASNVALTGEASFFKDVLGNDTSITRKQNRLFYASSPDRGLKLLLENWFRIRERFPDAELHVAYGFNNMETIARMAGGKSWHVGFQRELEGLLKQDGVTNMGRLPLDKLYKEWFEANLWVHPTDFPETSMITCMDAQACGAIPVTNNHWAAGENVEWGYMVDGCPQHSEIIRSLWLDNLYRALDQDMDTIEPYRQEMMQWSRKKYDWERVVDQWKEFYKRDIKDLS